MRRADPLLVYEVLRGTKGCRRGAHRCFAFGDRSEQWMPHNAADAFCAVHTGDLRELQSVVDGIFTKQARWGTAMLKDTDSNRVVMRQSPAK